MTISPCIEKMHIFFRARKFLHSFPYSLPKLTLVQMVKMVKKHKCEFLTSSCLIWSELEEFAKAPVTISASS